MANQQQTNKTPSTMNIAQMLGGLLEELSEKVTEQDQRIKELEKERDRVITSKTEMARELQCSRKHVYDLISQGIVRQEMKLSELRELRRMGVV